MKPSVGRIVHFSLPLTSKRAGEIRPAIITQVWEDDRINAKIVLDGTNDHGEADHAYTINRSNKPQPGCWNWPERV